MQAPHGRVIPANWQRFLIFPIPLLALGDVLGRNLGLGPEGMALMLGIGGALPAGEVLARRWIEHRAGARLFEPARGEVDVLYRLAEHQPPAAAA